MIERGVVADTAVMEDVDDKAEPFVGARVVAVHARQPARV
jgi:hypothetical protein